MRTKLGLLAALIGTAAVACTRPTPGYCGPPKWETASCTSQGMVCNMTTHLCERPESGVVEVGSWDASSTADGRDADNDTDTNGPAFERCDGGTGCQDGKSCVDGVCCASASCGTCQSCAIEAYEGTCAPVPELEEDVNSQCSGESACDGAGACKKRNGESCSAATECLSTFCIDGVCCGEACTATCYGCNLAFNVGSCRPLNGVGDPNGSPPCSGTHVCHTTPTTPPTCKLEDRQPCTNAGDCFSNACPVLYADADRDGFGTGSPVQICGADPPSGYADRPGDCCEMDPLVRPNQTAFQTRMNQCGTWDYNCDNRVENNDPNLGVAMCGCSLDRGGGSTCVGCR